MEVIEKTYLKSTSFQLLQNWSVRYLLESRFSYNEKFELVTIGSFLRKSSNKTKIEKGKLYQRVTVKINNGGVIPRDTEFGENIGTKIQFEIKPGQFLMSKIDARNGAFGLVPADLDGAIVTNDFPVFDVDNSKVMPEFLVLITTTKEFIQFAQSCSSGTTNRQRIDIESFLNVKIPLPTLTEQKRIVDSYNIKIIQAEELEEKAKNLEEDIEEYFYAELGYKKDDKINHKNFRTISYSKLARWDFKEVSTLISKYPIIKVRDLVQSISTGTTPPTSNKEYFENGKIQFYTPADLGQEKYLNNAERKVTSLAIKNKKARQFNRGTLLFVGIGSTVGKVGIVNNEFAASNQQITGLTFHPDNVSLEYVYYYFYYFKHITTKEKTQATIPIVNQDKILNIPIPFPNKEVQIRISEEISKRKVTVKELKENSYKTKNAAIKDFRNEIFKICN
ncbi:MAG: restriction endonuclease subunit S [Candidatus Delongbacteria bacterium]|nr:restriction endonuclease subunit S [Candidatus Delongbacteria bacterium]